jgi:type IV fimbrial biogenesis protein FimT
MAVGKKHATGYTLIELMAVLAIASTLLVVAIPMFRTQVQNGYMSAAATDLLSTFMSAKAQAIGRNYPVTVCISNNAPDPADLDCANNGQWEDGWLTFVDINRSDTFDAGDEVVQVHPPLADKITARSSRTGEGTLENSVTYRPNGHTNLNATRELFICNSAKYGVTARVLIVSILGKASILKDEDVEEDGCPADYIVLD